MRDGGRREEREHSIIMVLIAIYTTVILTGLMILLIGLNEMVTVAIIVIRAVGVDEAHGAVGGLQPWIQTLQHQRQKNLQKATGGRGERRGSTKLQEREEGRLVMRILEIIMRAGEEEEAEARGVRCIMGSPPAV